MLLLCRALAARQVGEYLPWQVAGPHLVKIKNLLALNSGGNRSGCAAAFKNYVLQNVTAPFMAGLQAAYGSKCALPPLSGILLGLYWNLCRQMKMHCLPVVASKRRMFQISSPLHMCGR